MRSDKEIQQDMNAHENEWGYIGISDAVRIEIELLLDIRNLLKK